MAQLLVRELEDDVADGLRSLAAANKRSAEEEHRAALRTHVRDNLTGPKKRQRILPFDIEAAHMLGRSGRGGAERSAHV